MIIIMIIITMLLLLLLIIIHNNDHNNRTLHAGGREVAVAEGAHLGRHYSSNATCLHPVRIARIHYPRFVPRVGLGFKEIRTLSALRVSKGWVRKDPNIGLRTGCNAASSVFYGITRLIWLIYFATVDIRHF